MKAWRGVWRGVTFAALLGQTLVVVGCRDGVISPTECAQMLDRYIDLTLAADPALAHLPEADARAVREMKKAVKRGERRYRRVQDQCEAEVRRHEYRCAMAASTANDWEACID